MRHHASSALGAFLKAPHAAIIPHNPSGPHLGKRPVHGRMGALEAQTLAHRGDTLCQLPGRERAFP